MDEIREQLAHIHEAGLGRDPDEVLRSPRDGQPFVVITGVDFDSTAKTTIWAYEQQGADGKRYVMTLSRDVKQVPDEDFPKATFAKGHKPASSKSGS